MSTTTGTLLLALFLAIVLSQASKPHLVFVLVDDWGFSDVGFRNPAISTPNFNNLVSNGLLLNRHYVFKYCSPSRASFLTGRWPHHAHQYNIEPLIKLGLNINMTTLPAKLKKAGYVTHMVGKWHEGYYDPKFLPINRGFDTSSGFLQGSEDHFNQTRDCATDFWKNTDVDPRNGSYDAYIYRSDLNEILVGHDETKPLFLYLPLHNVHGPYQAPQEWLDLYTPNSTCDSRRTLQAMISVADNITGGVVNMLMKKNMWSNTLMIVSADNGSPWYGSNYPLKGHKSTFYEGGVRALAFAAGGLVPENMRGTSTDGFIHIADWYPTFCKLAGVDHDDTGPWKFPVDGMDVWPIITGASTVSPHSEIVLGYDYNNTGAIISGNYKLIVGCQGKPCDPEITWFPLDHPCSKGPVDHNCDPYCLYDIVDDPTEKNDLSKTEPDLLKKMLGLYNAYSKEPRYMQDQGYHNDSSLPTNPDACQYMADHGGYWRPYSNINN